MQDVLKTATDVARESVHVLLDENAVARFAETLLSSGPQVPAWNGFLHYCGDPDETIAWLLVLDTINFCFWPEPGRPRWESKRPVGTFRDTTGSPWP